MREHWLENINAVSLCVSQESSQREAEKIGDQRIRAELKNTFTSYKNQERERERKGIINK